MYASGSTAQPWESIKTQADAGSMLGSATEQVVNATKRALELSSRARSIADSVFGAAAEAKGAGQPGAIPSGRASVLNGETRALHQALDELSGQIDRLMCI